MFTSAAPLFLSFFTSSAPGYTGRPIPSTTAASFVFTVIPPKGVAIFTLSLPFLLSDSIRHPLASTVAAISVATTKVLLFRILRLRTSQTITQRSTRRFRHRNIRLVLHQIGRSRENHFQRPSSPRV